MDLGDDILNGVVAAIASKCRAIGWNTCKLKSGKILLKVWYDGDKEKSGITQCDQDNSNSEFNPNHVSFRKMSEKQCKRNFHRAKRFRENSIEQPRSDSEIEHSTSTPNVIESTACFDQCKHSTEESSMSRKKL